MEAAVHWRRFGCTKTTAARCHRTYHNESLTEELPKLFTAQSGATQTFSDMQQGSSSNNIHDSNDMLESYFSSEGMAVLDEYWLMCPCSPSLRHRADLVVLGDMSTDHSLSFKEEIVTARSCCSACNTTG